MAVIDYIASNMLRGWLEGGNDSVASVTVDQSTFTCDVFWYNRADFDGKPIGFVIPLPHFASISIESDITVAIGRKKLAVWEGARRDGLDSRQLKFLPDVDIYARTLRILTSIRKSLPELPDPMLSFAGSRHSRRKIEDYLASAEEPTASGSGLENIGLVARRYFSGGAISDPFLNSWSLSFLLQCSPENAIVKFLSSQIEVPSTSLFFEPLRYFSLLDDRLKESIINSDDKASISLKTTLFSLAYATYVDVPPFDLYVDDWPALGIEERYDLLSDFSRAANAAFEAKYLPADAYHFLNNLSSEIDPAGHYIAHGRYEGRIAYEKASSPPSLAVQKLCAALRDYDGDIVIAPVQQRSSHKNSKALKVYRSASFLIKSFTKGHRDIFFFLPWLKRGGSDLETCYLLNAIAEITNPDQAIFLFLTQDSTFQPLIPLHPRVNTISLCVDEHTTQAEIALAISRIVIDYQPSLFVNSNSSAAWTALRQYGGGISAVSRVVSMLFCFDYTENGTPVGYAVSHVPDTIDYHSTILIDNETFVKSLSEYISLSEDQSRILRPVYYPTQSRKYIQPVPVQGRPIVLWASRLDRQKRPDILLEVASTMPDLDFMVYGTELLDQPASMIQRLSSLPNVNCHGAYSSSAALPFASADVFLYTAQWDGLPNILLEVGAAGLPIVTFDTGGIGELVTERTGWPVSFSEGADGLVSRIRELLQDPNEAKARSHALRGLIRTRHTTEAFVQNVRSILSGI